MTKTIQEMVSESAQSFFGEKVQDVADRLREMAEQVERAGKRTNAKVRKRHGHHVVAEEILGIVLNGVNNMRFDRLIELAGEADDLPWPEEE